MGGDARCKPERTIPAVLTAKLGTDGPPSPANVISALVDEIGSRAAQPDYDLSRIAMQTWVEALRDPARAERARTFYLLARSRLTELALRWRPEGWTWLVIAAHIQLRLAQPLAEDLRRPWENPAPHDHPAPATTPPHPVTTSGKPLNATSP